MPAVISKKSKIFSPPGKIVSKYEVDNGMIVTFRYSGGSDIRPLVFVMDTDEYVSPAKNKSFSGYYEIYDGIYVVEEVQGRAKARRVALKLAKSKKETVVNFLGDLIDVE